jgi:glycine cleavage system H lipoate-binding protein
VSHRYCELYLALAHSGTSEPLAAPADRATDERVEMTREYWIEGIRVPAGVAYSTNHMWLDVSEDGYCHVGVDAFLTKVLGTTERISFVTGKGIKRPTVVLTVHDVDCQMVFPNRMLVTGSNTYLRVHPDKLVSDPYGLGWLFEGLGPPSSFPETDAALSAGLMRGTVALAWMQQEIHRLAEFMHELLFRTSPRDEALIKDGAGFWEGVVQRLEREQILQLFNAFFSPYTN